MMVVAAPLGDWAARALCRTDDTVSPAIFDTDPLRSKKNMAIRDAEAKAVCARCPVRAECLAHALFYHEPDSVYGGLNPADRGEWQDEYMKTYVRKRDRP